MRSSSFTAMLLLAFPLAYHCADPRQPHYHHGKIEKYEIGPPSLLLSPADEEKLKGGGALMQAIVQEDGITRRLVMVKNVPAPADVVSGRILDLDAYPRMIKSCDRTATYHFSESQETGIKVIRAKYEIRALHLPLSYFMEHTWDPTERCMVFSLDYSRRSDLDDSVGYWYIQPIGSEECRIYYSCVTKLRAWVPGPLYAIMTKYALREATAWVEDEAVKEWEAVKLTRPDVGMVERLRGRVEARLRDLKLPELPKFGPPAAVQRLLEGRPPPRPEERQLRPTRALETEAAEVSWRGGGWRPAGSEASLANDVVGGARRGGVWRGEACVTDGVVESGRRVALCARAPFATTRRAWPRLAARMGGKAHGRVGMPIAAQAGVM